MSNVKDLLKSGKIAEASALLQQEINAHPGNAEAHQLIGRVYLLAGDEVKASEAFDKAVSLDKGYREKVLFEYYEAGLILLKDPKKSNVGLHYLNKYLHDRPDKGIEFAAIFYTGGFKMIEANKFMAHVILERAKELNPSYEKDEGFYFSYSVKSAHKPADVISGGENFLARFPQSSSAAEVLYLMGEASQDLHKPQEARKYFYRASKEFPETEWGKKAASKLK